MSSHDHKLPPDHDEEFADVSADERREAEALRDALYAAMHPAELDDDLNETLIARALERMPRGRSASGRSSQRAEAPATKLEARDAGLLRAALEDEVSDHPLAELARATRNAHSPRSLDDFTNERLLRPALRAPSRGAARRTLTGAIFAAVAVAAGVFGVWLDQPQPTVAPRADLGTPTQDFVVDESALVESRSTTDLFQAEDFPKTGGVTDRIDRITESRNADLRENRFVSWGVP